jgi:hypothetical protein
MVFLTAIRGVSFGSDPKMRRTVVKERVRRLTGTRTEKAQKLIRMYMAVGALNIPMSMDTCAEVSVCSEDHATAMKLTVVPVTRSKKPILTGIGGSVSPIGFAQTEVTFGHINVLVNFWVVKEQLVNPLLSLGAAACFEFGLSVNVRGDLVVRVGGETCWCHESDDESNDSDITGIPADVYLPRTIYMGAWTNNMADGDEDLLLLRKFEDDNAAVSQNRPEAFEAPKSNRRVAKEKVPEDEEELVEEPRLKTDELRQEVKRVFTLVTDYEKHDEVDPRVVGEPDIEVLTQASPKAQRIMLGIQKDLLMLSELRLQDAKAPNKFQMRIKLRERSKNASLIEPQHKLSDSNKRIFREYIAKSLEDGVIEKIDVIGKYCTNHCFPRSQTKVRSSIVASKLNQETEPVATQSRDVNTIVANLDRTMLTVMSVIDVRWAFNLVEIHPDDRQYTAFYGADGDFYQYIRMPFGLKNAPTTFDAFMVEMFKHLNEFVVTYVDDILVMAGNPDEAVMNLRTVVDLMVANNVPVRWQKLKLLRRTVEYLGAVLNEDGEIAPNQKSVDAIQNATRPKNMKEMQSFVGLARWVQKYTPHLAFPLKKLTDMIKKKERFIWTEERILAFDEVKKLVSQHVKLSTIDNNAKGEKGKLYIYTDASDFGIGALMFQGDRLIKVLSYAFNDAQAKWSTINQEAYALVKTLGAWRHDLLNRHFTVLTDHRPLLFLVNTHGSEKGSMLTQRWLMLLKAFDFSLVHTPGSKNPADWPTRPPFLVPDKDNRKAELFRMRGPVEQSIDKMGEARVLHLTVEELKPKEDLFYATVRSIIVDREDPTQWSLDDPRRPHLSIFRRYAWFVLEGRLWLKVNNRIRTLITKAQGREIFDALHKKNHAGVTRAQRQLRELYYWRGYNDDIREWCGQCVECMENKSTVKPPVKAGVKKTARVWEHINADLVTLPKPDDPDAVQRYVLAIRDSVTRFTVLKPIFDKTAGSVRAAYESTFRTHGDPGKLTIDMGTESKNRLVKEWCNERKIIFDPLPAKDHNAVVERVVTEWWKQVKLLGRTNDNSMDVICEMVAERINTTWCVETNLTPFNMFYGRESDEYANRERPVWDPDDDVEVDFYDRREVMQEEARQRSTDRRQKAYDKAKRPRTVPPQVGEIRYYPNTDLSSGFKMQKRNLRGAVLQVDEEEERVLLKRLDDDGQETSETVWKPWAQTFRMEKKAERVEKEKNQRKLRKKKGKDQAKTIVGREDKDKEFVTEEIFGRAFCEEWWYRVKWAGFPSTSNTWENHNMVEDAVQGIEKSEREHIMRNRNKDESFTIDWKPHLDEFEQIHLSKHQKQWKAGVLVVLCDENKSDDMELIFRLNWENLPFDVFTKPTLFAGLDVLQTTRGLYEAWKKDKHRQ